jgi:hypothetical protein
MHIYTIRQLLNWWGLLAGSVELQVSQIKALVMLNTGVGIVLGYRLDDRGSIPGRGRAFFSTPQRPDWL